MILREIERIYNKEGDLRSFSYKVFSNLYDLILNLAIYQKVIVQELPHWILVLFSVRNIEGMQEIKKQNKKIR